MMGVVGTLEGEASGFIGEADHFGIGGRLAEGGPIVSAAVNGGVGVEFCSSIRIKPSLLCGSFIRGISDEVRVPARLVGVAEVAGKGSPEVAELICQVE